MSALLGACLAKRAYAERDRQMKEETRSDTSSSLDSLYGDQVDAGDSNDNSRVVSDTKRAIMETEKTIRTRSLVDSMWQSLE